jgi:AraC-like DNA-binding protein
MAAGLALTDALRGSESDTMVLELLAAFHRAGERPDSGKWLDKIQEELRATFHAPRPLGALANDAAVHPVYLCRAFRSRTGLSITEFVNRLRTLDAASRILAGSSVGEASIDAGFYDQFHFSRVLHRQFGIRPKAVKALGKLSS